MIKFLDWWEESFEKFWDDGDATPTVVIPIIISGILGFVLTIYMLHNALGWYLWPSTLFSGLYLLGAFFDATTEKKSVGRVLGVAAGLFIMWPIILLGILFLTIAFACHLNFPHYKGKS